MINVFRSARIYFILAFFYCNAGIFSWHALAQIPLEAGDYRSIASGDFENPGIWETWDGANWIPATQKPAQNNNVFIDQGNEVRLTGPEAVNHLYLFSAADPGRKLNLQAFELHVYGALRALRKESGEFFLNSVSSLLIDWIYPETGKIVFKGNSRTVVDRASWSANTINSRYMVVFDPLPGEVLTVNSAFKANAFVIQSGTVIQTVNTMGLPACSTFSFNNQELFNGLGPYGNLIIEPGATLVSDCTAPLDPILRRSAAITAALFHLKPGGTLILRGNTPLIDAATVLLEGLVSYEATTGNQNMIQRTFANSEIPTAYHHLRFREASEKQLQANIRISGNLIQESSGPILDGPSTIIFDGTGVQQILGWTTTVSTIEINKPSGSMVLDSDLRVGGSLYMRAGQINFNGFDLFINEFGMGELMYEGGTWLNLRNLHYADLPFDLNPSNASFPFEDLYQGGIRKLQLIGNSPGGDLQIRFHEIPGADWDPDFNDHDGTPILYQLRSYFEIFSSLSVPLPLEMRISAQNLIVDQVDDLRIVSDGLAAPGDHLPGWDPTLLWARRNLNFSDLHNNTFTVGSYRELSVLPVTWLEESAVWKNGNIKITWSTAAEKDNQKFFVHRSQGPELEFEIIAEIPSQGDTEEIQHYQFEYRESLHAAQIYFQIEQVDNNGSNSKSRVFRLQGWEQPHEEQVKVWPNPYSSGPIQVQLPGDWEPGNTSLEIWSSKGIMIGKGLKANLGEVLKGLNDGIYFLHFKDGAKFSIVRLVIIK